jgi:DNA-binding winged helix-turn-helix (wHTH) protein/Tfp pilus assembly protein PilF
MAPEPVDLARAPDFMLGAVRVKPSTREVVSGATRTVIEPRVMEVLVALARANGEVVTRDDLVAACWGGRAVSDDAINRVISRLRGLSETAGGFVIETITKVGYRLARGEAAPDAATVQSAATPARRAPSRRIVLIGAGAAGAAIAGAALWNVLQPAARPSASTPPAQVKQLYDQAVAVLGGNDPETDAQAIAFLREAVAMAPDYADAWAALAIAYANSLDTTPLDTHASVIQLAEDAVRRALAIDPGNADARGARAMLLPVHGAWLDTEAKYREALALTPKRAPVKRLLAALLLGTGRAEDALVLARQAVDEQALTPMAHFVHNQALWTANRIEEAERALEQTAQLWPRAPIGFFPRVYFYFYTGRARRALDIVADEAARPVGIPASDFDLVASVGRALVSGSAADRKIALDLNRAAAPRGAGYAFNAMSFAAALGDLDMAFEMAGAYYFGRPFSPAGADFSAQQGLYTAARVRQTISLFFPHAVALRTDPRFAALVEEMGLAAYWRSSGKQPDFCARSPAEAAVCARIMGGR